MQDDQFDVIDRSRLNYYFPFPFPVFDLLLWYGR